MAARPEAAEPGVGVELVSVAAAEVLLIDDSIDLDGVDVATVVLANGVATDAVPGMTGTPGTLTVPLVKAEAGRPGARGTELATEVASVVLGTLRGVTATATDSVTIVEPDWTTTGLMAVARGLLGVQYSGIDVIVTVTVPSRGSTNSRHPSQYCSSRRTVRLSVVERPSPKSGENPRCTQIYKIPPTDSTTPRGMSESAKQCHW